MSKNQVSSSDDIMSNMTIKGLFKKWMSKIHQDICCALFQYYMKSNNRDTGDREFTESLFREVGLEIKYVTPILEDMTVSNLYGMEDIFIAAYGVTSDEVFVIRRFLDRYKCIDEWDEDYMWNDCGSDRRMLDILTSFNQYITQL
jgi:hypothetical protein